MNPRCPSRLFLSFGCMLVVAVSAQRPSLASDAEERDAANSAVLASVVHDTTIALDGSYTVAGFINILSKSCAFTFTVPKEYASTRVRLSVAPIHATDLLLRLARECDFQYTKGESGELQIKPRSVPPNPRCESGAPELVIAG